MNVTAWSREFSGKTVVVTGGSGQIGSVLAGAYHGAGARVVNLDLVPPGDPAAISFLQTNIVQSADVARAIHQVIDAAGGIDILVNCAGIGVFTPFEARTEQEFDAVTDVNLKGTFLVSQAVSKAMVTRRSGIIVNVGSIYGISAADQRIYGRSGRNSSEVYAMTKAGVIHFTRYLARYLAPHGVRVNCISPGGLFADQDPEFVRHYVHKTPLGRMGTPEDLIGGVFYLTSSLSEYVTGHNLVIDGGFTIGD